MRDVAILFGGTIIFAIMCLFGEVNRVSGVILLVIFAAFIFTSYFRGQDDPDVLEEHAEELAELEKGVPKNVPVAFALTVGGIVGLAFGADLLVTGGAEIARSFGVFSEEVIGLTFAGIWYIVARVGGISGSGLSGASRCCDW